MIHGLRVKTKKEQDFQYSQRGLGSNILMHRSIRSLSKAKALPDSISKDEVVRNQQKYRPGCQLIWFNEYSPKSSSVDVEWSIILRHALVWPLNRHNIVMQRG